MPKGAAGAELGIPKDIVREAKKAATPKPDKIGRRGGLAALIEHTRDLSARLKLANLARQSGRIHRNTGADSPSTEEPKTEAPTDTKSAVRRRYKRIDTHPTGASSRPVNSASVNEPAKNTGSGTDVQQENDELLADSVRVEKNYVSRTGDELPTDTALSESAEDKETGAIDVEAGTESKLISAENAGAQAILLTGESATKSIDRKKLEAIANGEKPDAKEATEASIRERDEYWNGENSPYKNLTDEQKYELWKKKTQVFLDRFKGKPQAELFKRMGVDLEDPEAVDKMYQALFVDGEGDVGLFASKIAQNNTIEQIQENMDVIQKMSGMYGADSSKVVVQMAIGIKNTQTDLDAFIKAAGSEIKKGKDMPGMDLVKNLYKNLEKEMGKKAKNESVDANTEDESESQPKEKEKKIGGEQKWLGAGELSVDGDSLVYSRESVRPKNPFDKGTEDYDESEEYLASHYAPQEISLGVRDGDASEATGREVKKPTAALWKIIETNPDRLATKFYVRQGVLSPVGAFRGATIDAGRDSVRMRAPFGKKVKNAEGATRNVDVNYSWNKLTLNRETLIKAQQKAIEYLEQQVAAGAMPQETLGTAKALVSRYKAPRTVVRPREIPVISKFRGPEKWRSDGSLAVHGHDIVYTTDELKKYRASRSVQITTVDPNNPSRRILTAQAWDVLDAASKGVNGSRPVTDSLTEPVMRRGGEWCRPVAPFTADRPMLDKMRGLIRESVSEAINEGAMGEDVLQNIDRVANYQSANNSAVS